MAVGEQEREAAPDVFAAAVAAEIPRLRRFARVLIRPAEAADDLVQETVLRAIAARSQFTPGTNLRAWLFVILRNARNAELRRLRRFAPLDDEAGRAIPVSGGQEERHAMTDVAAAFLRLPPTQREALWLVVVEGMGYAAAASVLRIPVGTVRSRLSRARDALRAALE
ncbi:RNA polymerase sigma factor [Falsiroseomonas stagni]|uniref:RNA polymerase sigma-70 factor, ECF subfamily n=1 Tax=Falsiroseomonas stagni DSM 19981 TaxID=1123062 RepID=A0A1I3XY83_9PROT|nr:sigma-70 family RNA polymerase sigma factor [Falsiroseomonas stagni]SFK24500.1 RNA polymerase sigma-70 factor, ECF subfamily [Falsiroseomonas stagni DSM 19981]